MDIYTIRPRIDTDKIRPAIDYLFTPFLVAASQTELTIKEGTCIKIINNGRHTVLCFDEDTTFAVSDKLDTGSIEAAKDYYVYLCDDGEIKISLNSTYPSGYNADNSRKVGGFHTLCDAVGTIAGHTLNGYATGAILPASVWCLNHRPRCSPEGMVWSAQARIWVDIYLQSSTGATTASVYGATITDTRTWMDHVDDLAAVEKRLLNDDEFQIIAEGSNQETNIYGTYDPVTAGKCASVKFTGSGLDDLSVDRTNFDQDAQEYEVEIDTEGTPDTFKWRQRDFTGSWGGYTTGVSITGSPQTLANGITITFGATTGHTLGDKWNLYVMNGLRDTSNRRMISNIGVEGACGALRQWLRSQSHRFDGATNHTHEVTVSGDPETVTTSNPSGDVAPSWSFYNLDKGTIYKQGTYGDVKLLAGGYWEGGSGCGSQSRSAYYYRWRMSSSVGGRGCAEPR